MNNIVISEGASKVTMTSMLLAVGTAALRADGFVFSAFGFQMVYSTLFLALCRGKMGGILSMSRQGISFIPLIMILPGLLGYPV